MAEGLTLVADSSAWISYFREQAGQEKEWLKQAIFNHTVLVPDLVLVEVLRGIDSESESVDIGADFNNFEIVSVGGKTNALAAAWNYRLLRAKGITVRGTVDLLVATWCVVNKIPLLHADRDFDGFEEHLGLKVWRGA